MAHAVSNAIGPVQERIIPKSAKERSKRTGEVLAAAEIIIANFTVAERMAWAREFYNAANPPR